MLAVEGRGLSSVDMVAVVAHAFSIVLRVGVWASRDLFKRGPAPASGLRVFSFQDRQLLLS